MCSFLVYTKNDVSMKDFKEGLEKIKYRGPDMTRVIEDNGMWGFNRLAIMGLNDSGMQPFVRENKKVVCNGEIYGFRKIKDNLIKKGYDFKSESDCEILLPLLKEKGLDMFKELDAEFACVMFDGKDFIAARDPIGIRPLFYGYSKVSKNIMFASEAKALIKLCDEILPFPPGHYYYKGDFISYCDPTKVDKINYGEIDEITSNIKDKLEQAVIKRLDADAPLGFLLSGGLDSSLVCSIAAK